MRAVLRRTITIGAALAATALSAQQASDSTLRTPDIPDESCLEPPAPGAAPAAQPPPVLIDGLGYAGLEPDSDHAEARDWFAQGVRLIWAFDEAEAIRAFQQAQRFDPDCAMCFFGEAWARSPTLNLRPRTEELPAARAAAHRALALSEGARDRNHRRLIEAMVLRAGSGDAFRNDAYANVMETLALRHPDNDIFAVMAADARMVAADDLRPGALPQRLLERVLARNPGHGGAIHFYIHLTDWIDRQHLAVPHAERLARIAPAASHLIHMPSHSYYGVGRYADAAAANVAAIAADRAFISRIRPPRSDYRYYLQRHNMHFAINSALARGDGDTARRVADQYRAEYLAGTAEQSSRLLGSAVWYAHALHDRVDAVLAMPEPNHALDKAMRHYARGEALARRGDGEAVRGEAAAIAAVRDGTQAPALGRGGAMLAEVAQHVLEGRAAMLAGRHQAAERAYRAAMEAQLRARFGSDPPLFWYSVRRSLAAALLAQGDHRGARNQLHASLRTWPNDALALYALALADRAGGNEEAALRNLARARAVWAGDVTEVPLTRI